MKMENKIVSDIFSSFQDYFNNEQEIRDQLRDAIQEIERHAREIVTTLQIIHHENPNADTKIPQACQKARQFFDQIRIGYQKLAAIVPADQYYRYSDHWRYVTQRLCFLAALIVFLEVGTLISKETCAEFLGVYTNPKNGFHLELEDYLMGLLQLSTELARFAVNSVTIGEYQRPLQISKFVAELNAGFRLLNLKNDMLRKKFDALKYDVKKIEEVVYDLSIRGLRTDVPSAEGMEKME